MASLEYLSGFFDADGTIGIYTPYGRQTANIRLSVTQKFPAVLFEYEQQWGGSIYHHPSGHWVWGIAGRAALKAVIEMSPHLIEKRQQADVCREYISLIGIQGCRVVSENLARRKLLESQLREMKTKATASW